MRKTRRIPGNIVPSLSSSYTDNMDNARLPSYTGRLLVAVAIMLVGVAGVLYFVWSLARVFLLLFAGGLLAVFLGGLATALSKRTPLPYGASLALVLVAVAVFFAGAGLWIGPRLAEQGSALAERLPEAIERVRSQLTVRYAWARELFQRAPNAEQVLSGSGGGLPSEVVGAASIASTALTNALIVGVIGIYLAISPGLYTQGATRLLPKPRRARAGEALSAAGHALRWWLVGRFASMVVVGILTGTGLFVAGVPLALTLGFIAALLSFVPYIGPIAAAVPAVLIALTISPAKALYVVGIYALVQILESYLITPMIQDRAVSIPPALLVSAQVVAGVLAGLLGILIATPLAVTVVVAVQMLYVEDALGDQAVEVLGEGEAHAEATDAAEEVSA